ncbi:MAG: hypothetical protein ABSH12_05220 [Endomicrobiales bacterium]
MKKIIPLFCCLLLLTACDLNKKSRLAADTLRISIDPPTIGSAVVVNSTVTLRAVCTSGTSSDVNVSPTWSVENNLGVFTPAKGKNTVFKAGTAGFGHIYATVDPVRSAGVALTVISSVTVSTGTTPVVPSTGTTNSTAYYIYSYLVHGFNTDLSNYGPPAYNVVGTNYGGTPVVGITVGLDTTQKINGTEPMISTYTVTFGDDYADWFVTFSTPKDMSAYSAGYLIFDVQSSVDLQVGILSSNINANTNNAKVYLSSYGTVTGTSFTTISIPIADLVALQPGTDLTQITNPFIVAVIASHVGVTGTPQSNQFWIDNIRWGNSLPGGALKKQNIKRTAK